MHSELPICDKNVFPVRSVIISGGTLLVVSCFGLLGNCFCVTFLIRKYFARSVFRIYLKSLCIIDSITLLCSIFALAFPILSETLQCEADVHNSISHIVLISYPIGVMAEGASTLTTSAISVVRFVSVRYPLKTRILARPDIARTIVGVVLMVTVLINSPRVLELGLKPCLDVSTNASVLNIGTTSLRENPIYKNFYMFYSCTVLMFGLPFLTILICNLFIVTVLFRSSRNCIAYGRHGGMNSQSELMATKLIFVLCLSFLCCHSMPFIIDGLEATAWVHTGYQGAEVYSVMVDVSNLLVVIKASSNFLLYLAFNSRFRRNVSEWDLMAILRSVGARVVRYFYHRTQHVDLSEIDKTVELRTWEPPTESVAKSTVCRLDD